jgi:hypothetical protein
LQEILEERVVVSENGHRKSLTKLQAILKQIANNALRGDHRSIRRLLTNQIPKMQEYEEARSLASQPEEQLPPGAVNLFAGALELVVESGAVPQVLLRKLLTARTRECLAKLEPALDIEIPPTLPPSTPRTTEDVARKNRNKPEDDPPF